ncbi:hypothetical protein KPH14_001053 [Odynerus spinipes]|uniref:Cytochrome P450 n=1 Tax=Odynerus spinipes TaxID=1348599 RepID=A0AAD9VI42_9HYME|nr:hypothetical protein KPH14_001053 [Odynerus spinipes]
MSLFLLVILFFIIIYESYKYLSKKPPGTPPGIVGLPIIGVYWFLLWGDYDFPHRTLAYYTKKLKSKLISCYLGSFFTVIANDYATIKEVSMREEFDGRISEGFIAKKRAFDKKLGIFFTEGEQWREQRRFALRHMRDFGFGRRQEIFEAKIMEELNIFIDTLRNGPIGQDEEKILKSDMVLFPDVLYAIAGNNIWDIMFGYRFKREKHEKMRYFGREAMKFQRAADTIGGAIAFWPFLHHFGNLFSYKNIIDSSYALIDFIKEYLQRYKAEMYEQGDDYGFVGRYLNKLKEDNLSPYFSEEQLILSVIDFMFPAITAMPSVVTHAIKLTMHHPDVAKKVRDEIHTVVGTGRLVTWDDRKSLPYTEATLRETMRYETLTPLSVFHKCTKDTTLQGYFIPAGTVMVNNLAGMDHDPDFWGDPENFRPERFLTDDGQLNKDMSFPFGIGHRVCAGETFGRLTLFGTFACLMQNFDFLFVEGQPTGIEDKLHGLIVSPKNTWIRIKPRHTYMSYF